MFAPRRRGTDVRLVSLCPLSFNLKQGLGELVVDTGCQSDPYYLRGGDHRVHYEWCPGAHTTTTTRSCVQGMFTS